MSIDIDHLLVETATRVATTYNENGDVMYGSTTSVACLFRDISSLSNVQNRYEIGIDGILWFAASEAAYATRGAVYYHPDEGYLRIKLRLPAKRRLVDNTVQFIKCGVEHHRQTS